MPRNAHLCPRIAPRAQIAEPPTRDEVRHDRRGVHRAARVGAPAVAAGQHRRVLSPVRHLGRKAVEASHDFEYPRLVPSLPLEPSNPRRQQRRRWSTAGEVSSSSGSGSGSSSSSSSRLAQQQQQRRQGRSSFSGAAAAAASASSSSSAPAPPRDARRDRMLSPPDSCARVHVCCCQYMYICVWAVCVFPRLHIIRNLRENVISVCFITTDGRMRSSGE